jgi:hypothetical protein
VELCACKEHYCNHEPVPGPVSPEVPQGSPHGGGTGREWKQAEPKIPACEIGEHPDSRCGKKSLHIAGTYKSGQFVANP